MRPSPFEAAETVSPVRLAAQLADVVASQLGCAARLDAVDARAALLDTVRQLVEMAGPLLAERLPGDEGLRVMVLVRELEQRRRAMAAECEAELRIRAMHARRAAPAPVL